MSCTNNKKRGRISAGLYLISWWENLVLDKENENNPHLTLAHQFQKYWKEKPKTNPVHKYLRLTRSVNNIVRSILTALATLLLLVQELRHSSHSCGLTQTAFGPNKSWHLYHVGSNTRVFLRVGGSHSFLLAAVKGLISPPRWFYFHHIKDVYLAAVSDHFLFSRSNKVALLSPIDTHRRVILLQFSVNLPLLPIFNVIIASCCTIRPFLNSTTRAHRGSVFKLKKIDFISQLPAVCAFLCVSVCACLYYWHPLALR